MNFLPPPTTPATPGRPSVAVTLGRDRVEELLKLLGKAARAHQLYLPNNPVYKAAHDALRTGFVPVWDLGDEFVLSFTESEVKWEGEIVLEESTRGSDSLPWIFYKDGVREIRMRRGFEGEELDKLLGILQRVRKASPDEDDLLTLLWQGDFVFLRYRYVDMSVEATVPLADGGEAIADSHDPREISEGRGGDGDGESEETQESRNPGVVNMSDFDGTLYFLDEREIEYLQSEVKREYDIDLRQNVVGLLLDIFEQQPNEAVRNEVAEALDSMMLHMLSAGQFRNVSYLMRECATASQRAPSLTAEHREVLSQLPVRLSAPEALAQLLQALDEAAELPPQQEVLELFEQLRPTALGTVFEWLGRLSSSELRTMLEAAASRLASGNTAELVKLVQSPIHSVSLEAIKRAGALQTPAAVAPVTRVLAEGNAELRLAAVQALNDIGSPSALQGLDRAIEDKDREVRVASIRALMLRAYRPALPKLEGMVKGKSLKDSDLSEKMVVFEAYGALCGDGGVPLLDGMLNGKSMFGRREDPDLRACAAVALGRIKTMNATESLKKAVNDKEVVVRNAVGKALRRGTTIS